MTKRKIVRFILRGIGNLLILFAIFGVLATFGPALFYEARYRIAKVRGVEYVVPDISEEKVESSPFGEILKKERLEEQSKLFPQAVGFAQVLTGPKEQILIPKDTQFSILIPKIGATAKVFPNVDSSNENAFLPVLQEGVAHAKGTVFPGQNGNIYLFAHSADNFWNAGRYNAMFYLLKDLSSGDEVIVFFENLRHSYVVSESKIVEASDVSYLVESQNNTDQILLLQTCWPPGTTWKRLIVVAKPK